MGFQENADHEALVAAVDELLAAGHATERSIAVDKLQVVRDYLRRSKQRYRFAVDMHIRVQVEVWARNEDEAEEEFEQLEWTDMLDLEQYDMVVKHKDVISGPNALPDPDDIPF